MNRILTHLDLYSELRSFQALPFPIDQQEMGEKAAFEMNWEKVFGCEEADKAKEVVYVWVTDKPIPRMSGESNIIYIGQTGKTLKTRHFQNARIEATGKSNKLKYPNIIKDYGKISILYHHFRKYGKSLKDAENQLLWWYFENHFEYPPLNYTKASKYKSCLILDMT